MEPLKDRILYIEDHDDTVQFVKLALAGLNYRVTTTSTIESALTLARENDFDLYILDSWLPDGSGIDLCKRLREFDQCTPIMFFSGAAFEADKQSAINSGAQRYVMKPASFEILCSEVTTLMESFRENKMD